MIFKPFGEKNKKMDTENDPCWPPPPGYGIFHNIFFWTLPLLLLFLMAWAFAQTDKISWGYL